MKILNKINNGVLLIIIGIMHCQFAASSNGFGSQFKDFSESFFYKISPGLDQLPAQVGVTNFEHFAAFSFFYFGFMVIPIGFLVFSIERKNQILPTGFTISYLFVVLIGVYMVPNSGITIFMLPHALFMFGINLYRSKAKKF